MEVNAPRSAVMLSRIRLRHDPDNGVTGKRVLIQEGDGAWWAGRVTVYANENREVSEGASGETATDAIMAALREIGDPA